MPPKDPPPESSGGFTDSDKDALRELAKERQHRAWLSELLKRWAQWAAAFSIGVAVLWDALAKLVHALSNTPPK